MANESLTQVPDRELLLVLGSRLRELRRSSGLTILEAASKANLDRGTVSRAEHGENPTVLTVLRLLRVYGRLAALDHFIPEPDVSPMTLLRKGREGG